MRKLLFVAIAATLATGCGTSKTRHLDISGAYVAQSGALAIGSVEVQSAPEGTESAMVSYEDSAAWFSDAKEHRIRILLTGTNSTASAEGIVSNICAAFTATAPVVLGANASTNAPTCKCGAREPEEKAEEPPAQM